MWVSMRDVEWGTLVHLKLAVSIHAHPIFTTHLASSAVITVAAQRVLWSGS